MRKSFFLLLTFFLTLYIYGQPGNSIQNYQLGTKALEDKRYQDAISFLTLSIEEKPTANSYFNRSVAYYYLGDSCKFCLDLHNASMLLDEESEKLYSKKCTFSDTVKLAVDSIYEEFPGYSYTRRTFSKCAEEASCFHYNQKGQPIMSIYVVLPEFPGGENARNMFMANNIVYPEKATRNGIQGIVYISFYVDTDGTIADIKVLLSPSDILSNEAIKVVKMMPKWKPGTRKGKPFKVLFNMPVSFILQG